MGDLTPTLFLNKVVGILHLREARKCRPRHSYMRTRAASTQSCRGHSADAHPAVNRSRNSPSLESHQVRIAMSQKTCRFTTTSHQKS
jgi:hypothetical protein